MKKLITIFTITIVFFIDAAFNVAKAHEGQQPGNSFLAPANVSSVQIRGGASICTNQTGVHYYIDSVPGAISYNWSVPSGAIITSGQGTTSITVNFATTLGDVCVTSFDGSVTSTPSCITTHIPTYRPVMPVSVTGPHYSVCPGHIVEYSCTNDANASNYTWEFPNCTILSGQGTNAVKVLVGPNFNWAYFRVSAQNCYGTSAQQVIAVYSAPGYPDWIMGPQVGACGGGTYTYSIHPVNGATSYTWFAPAGFIITSPVLSGNPLTTSVTSVQITVPVGFVEGAIYVCANSGCNSSQQRRLNIRSVPAYPNWIHGPSYGLCGQTNILFNEDSVPGATSYTWSIVPSDFTTIHNNGNDSITIDFAPGFVYARLYVSPNNDCGAGQTRSLALHAPPRAPLALRGPIGACNSNPNTSIAYYETDTIYGTGNYHWVVPPGANIISGQGTTHVTVNFLGSTNGAVAVRAENDCGSSDYDTMHVIVNACRMMGSQNVTASIVDMNVYPNPAHDKLNVTFKSDLTEKYSLKLIDLTGRIIISKTGESIDGTNTTEFSLSEYPKGLYLLYLERGEATERIKIVIE